MPGSFSSVKSMRPGAHGGPLKKPAVRWSPGLLGWGFKVAEGLCILGMQTEQSTIRCPHTDMHAPLTDHEARAGKKQFSTLKPGREAFFLLQCRSSILYLMCSFWKRNAQSPVHYPRAGTEGWVWSWYEASSTPLTLLLPYAPFYKIWIPAQQYSN